MSQTLMEQPGMNQTCHPAVAVDHIGRPTKLFNSFQNSATEKDRTLIIVCKEFAFVVSHNGLTLEVFFIVDEVYLHASRLNRGHFDDEWMIGIVNNEVHA